MITSIQAAKDLEGTHVARDVAKITSLDATRKRRPHRVRGAQSWLFPVSQAFQLVYDFDQPLKPPLIVGCCGAVLRANQVFAIRFGEFSYFGPQLFDTLRDQSRHRKHPSTHVKTRDLMRAKIFRAEIVENDFVENTGIIRGIVQSQTQTYHATASGEFSCRVSSDRRKRHVR